MAYVYAKVRFLTANDQGRVRVEVGDQYDADHPIVLAHAHNFADKPTRLNGERVVEQATAEPGVKRRTRAR